MLGVMHAHSLTQAIELQNAVAYGLTAGLYTQNPDDLALWLDRVEAGNLYVNRGITGRDRAAPAVRRLEALVGRRRHEGGRAELSRRARLVARVVGRAVVADPAPARPRLAHHRA